MREVSESLPPDTLWSAFPGTEWQDNLQQTLQACCSLIQSSVAFTCPLGGAPDLSLPALLTHLEAALGQCSMLAGRMALPIDTNLLEWMEALDGEQAGSDGLEWHPAKLGGSKRKISEKLDLIEQESANAKEKEEEKGPESDSDSEQYPKAKRSQPGAPNATWHRLLGEMDTLLEDLQEERLQQSREIAFTSALDRVEACAEQFWEDWQT